MDTSAATGKMHAPGSGGVPEKRPAPGGEKRMTKLLHGNEKNRLNGGREPLFSQKELLVLAVPLLVEQLLEVTVGMADTMMVSRCGEAAISGVSLVDMINNLIIVLFAALATGGAVVVSQYLGAKERGNADKSAGQLLLLSGLSGVVIGAVCFVLARPMIRLFYGSIDTDVLDAGVKYLQIIALSYPFLALYNGGAALFRSIGNSKISMQISFLMNIINIVGNAVCIFGFKMGVDGVAWPSVVSRVVAAALILRKCYREDAVLTVPKTLRLDGGMYLAGAARMYDLPILVCNNSTYISAEGYPLILGEGLVCSIAPGRRVEKYPTVTGGSYIRTKTLRRSPCLTIKSGTWGVVSGGSYHPSASAAGYRIVGNPTLTVSGGKVQSELLFSEDVYTNEDSQSEHKYYSYVDGKQTELSEQEYKNTFDSFLADNTDMHLTAGYIDNNNFSAADSAKQREMLAESYRAFGYDKTAN